MIIKHYSLGKNMAWLTLVPLLVLAVSLEAFFLNERSNLLDRELLMRGQLLARQLAASSEYGVFSNNKSFLIDAANSALHEADVTSVTIVNASDEVLVTTSDVPVDTNAVLGLVSDKHPLLDDGSRLLLYQPILPTQIALDEPEAKLNNAKIGAVVIEMSWAQSQKLKSRLLLLTILVTATFLFLTLYLVYLASRRITHPIRALSQAVEAIGAGDLDARVKQSSSIGELNTLIHGINHMAAELQYERAVLQSRIDEATEQLRNMAFYDTLTQLPNRRLLNDRLSQAMSANKRNGCYGAMIFLDMDNFKPLNDTYGHVVGDLLLIEVARRLETCTRAIDTVARFGGDEFVVMLAELDADLTLSRLQAKTVAEKVSTVLSEPYRLTITNEGKSDVTIMHQCTASIGVSIFNGAEASRDDVIIWADDAMYQAKEAGCNQIRFYGA